MHATDRGEVVDARRVPDRYHRSSGEERLVLTTEVSVHGPRKEIRCLHPRMICSRALNYSDLMRPSSLRALAAPRPTAMHMPHEWLVAVEKNFDRVVLAYVVFGDREPA
jgi:hypothetical protein